MDDAPIGEELYDDEPIEISFDNEDQIINAIDSLIVLLIRISGDDRERKVDLLNHVTQRINARRLLVEVPGIFKEHPTAQ
jgi:hypothetical protein